MWRVDLSLSHQLPSEHSVKQSLVKIYISQMPEKLPNLVKIKANVISDHLPIKTLLLYDYQKRDWKVGSYWEAKVNINPTIDKLNESGFNREAWALSRGIDGFGIVKERHSISFDYSLFNRINIKWEQIRFHVLKKINQYQKEYPQGTALVVALTLGVGSYLTAQNWDMFQRLGITHLVSISGLHVGMLVLFVVFFCFFILKIWSSLTLRFLPSNPKVIIVCIGLMVSFLYAQFAGFSIPTQRSFIMIAILSISVILRFFLTKWQIWWIALICVLLYDPKSILSIGFWLSFGLVASLLLVHYRKEKNKIKMSLINFTRAQYVATLATIVPLIFFFNKLPMLSPIVNLIAIPFFSFIITPFSLISVILPWDGLLHLVIFIAEYTMKVLTFMSGYAPIIPIAKSPFILVLLGFIATFILILPRGFGLKPWSCLIILLLLIYSPIKLSEKHVHFTVFDVGQGSSMLVETRNHTLLFDTGKKSVENLLIQLLDAKGIVKIDRLILSHSDDDHDGGFIGLNQSRDIIDVLAGEHQNYHSIRKDVSYCEGNKSWEWDGIYFEILTLKPWHKKMTHNNMSCVMRVLTDHYALIITGDLGKKGEEILVKNYSESLYSNVFILGHHGSNTSNSALFLDAIDPEYAISSSGLNNSFHHPNPKVLNRLKNRGIQLFRTDKQGTIEVYFTENILVEPSIKYKPYWQKKPLR